MINAVKFGAVVAQKTANPDIVRLVLTGEDRGKINNVPKDDTSDELVLTRQNGKLTIEKEEYDGSTTLTSIVAEPARPDELSTILGLSKKAVDAPDAKGAVQDGVKPLLRRTLNSANISMGDAYQKAAAAQRAYEDEKAVVDLFGPFMEWLKQR